MAVHGSVEELAPTASFEDACALFLDAPVDEVRRRLGEARVRASERLPLAALEADDVLLCLDDSVCGLD